MMLPVRFWAAAAASILSQQRDGLAQGDLARAAPAPGLGTRAPEGSLAPASGLRPRSWVKRVAAGRSARVSSSRARCAGTGLSKLATAGPGAARLASSIASSAPAGSPVACRIHANVISPAASGAVSTNWRHRAMPSVTCRSAISKVVPLVCHLGQAHVGRSCGRRVPVGRRQALQGLLAGQGRRVEAALGALDLGELIAAPCGRGELPGLAPAGDAGRESVLCLGQAAAEPLGYGQESLSDGVQQPLSFAALGQGPRGQRSRLLSVTAELGGIATEQGNQRRTLTSMLAARPTVGSNGSAGVGGRALFSRLVAACSPGGRG